MFLLVFLGQLASLALALLFQRPDHPLSEAIAADVPKRPHPTDVTGQPFGFSRVQFYHQLERDLLQLEAVTVKPFLDPRPFRAAEQRLHLRLGRRLRHLLALGAAR